MKEVIKLNLIANKSRDLRKMIADNKFDYYRKRQKKVSIKTTINMTANKNIIGEKKKKIIIKLPT